VKGRKPILAPHPIQGTVPAVIVEQALRRRHQEGSLRCIGYVIMPDHCHFVVKLLGGTIAEMMSSFSKFTAREIHALTGERGPFWQAGYYDHALRGEKSLTSYLAYMVGNPVRARLAVSPDEWPFTGVHPPW
jgi:putative transposase